MGYDIHITRAPEHWGDNRGHEIAESEWLELVAASSDLRFATRDDQYYMKGMVLWDRPIEGYVGPWLCWHRGNVYSKNPNVQMIAKMLELARVLQARVQGDDDEIYWPDGRVQRAGKFTAGEDWRTW